jgi:IS4 transposase
MKVCLATRYNSEIENYHIYVTNIQKEILDSKAIVKLYEVRWDIEVLFKDLKSKYQLHVI